MFSLPRIIPNIPEHYPDYSGENGIICIILNGTIIFVFLCKELFITAISKCAEGTCVAAEEADLLLDY